MAFDFKKEYKEFYLPKTKPALVTVPPMNYLAVRGKGDPNEENGAYQQAIGVRARGDDTTSPCYDFAPRVKNDWIRIGAKDFMKHLSRTSKIDFLTKAKQFIAEYDEETQTLIVVIDEAHLK